jgi:hypothetical protein
VIGHIDLHRVDHGTQMALAQLLSSRSHARHIAVPDRHACARSQHALRNGKSQTGGRTGDDRVAAFHIQQIHVGLSESQMVMPPSTM